MAFNTVSDPERSSPTGTSSPGCVLTGVRGAGVASAILNPWYTGVSLALGVLLDTVDT